MKLSALRTGRLVYVLCVALLASVASFLVAIILSSYRFDRELLSAEGDPVQVVRLNRFTGLASVNRYLQRVYGGRPAEPPSDQIPFEEPFALRTVGQSPPLRVHRLDRPIPTRKLTD